MNRNFKFVLPILIAAALLILPACQTQSAKTANVNRKKEAAETYLLPPEIVEVEMKTLDGKTVKISDYRGKVVLLNLWATWCGPCRQEIPELVKISQEMKDRGVEVVGMTSVDDRGNTESRVKTYVQQQAIPYNVVWATPNVAEEFSSMGEYQIPASFIIDREGKLTQIFKGFNPRRTPQKVREALEDALGS